jgi:5-methylcytosine-specific restriction enzyme A
VSIRPKSVCRHAGCTVLVDVAGHCEKHAKQKRRDSDERRGTAAERGYGSRWQKARVTYLVRNPLCVECKAEGAVRAATIVDHVEPHKGDQTLFWDTSNWQALCKPHHDRKTAREDGGFGRSTSR